ncbi:MAG: hypothetical protein M3Q75_15160 [Gemmatimonadota bacterium]|nr:hypothetical protein [Gemmatimonadota bacterium]
MPRTFHELVAKRLFADRQNNPRQIVAHMEAWSLCYDATSLLMESARSSRFAVEKTRTVAVLEDCGVLNDLIEIGTMARRAAEDIDLAINFNDQARKLVIFTRANPIYQGTTSPHHGHGELRRVLGLWMSHMLGGCAQCTTRWAIQIAGLAQLTAEDLELVPRDTVRPTRDEAEARQTHQCTGIYKL